MALQVRNSRPTIAQSTYSSSNLQGGTYNPQKAVGAQYLQPTYNPQSQTVNRQAAPALTPAASTTGGGTATRAAAVVDTAALQRAGIQNKINAIMGAYDALAGKGSTFYTDQANQLRQQISQNKEKYNNAFQQSANQITGAYQARGLGDSSFAANAQNTALNSYNTDIANLNTQEKTGLSKIGAAYEALKSKIDAARSTYRNYLDKLGTYGAADLTALDTNLTTGLQDVAAQQGQLGTQAENLASIQGITPTPTQGSSEIQKFLADLQNSGTTDMAKNAIAKGYIAQAVGNNPDQQTYWNDYFNSLKTTGKV